MATETTPIHDSLISELGSPSPATPIDCTYAAMVKLANGGDKAEKAEKASEPISLPAPAGAKRAAKAAQPKPFAVVGHDKAS